MELFNHAYHSIFSGRLSSVPPPPSKKGNTKCKNEDGNRSGIGTPGGFNPHPGVAAERRAGKRDGGVHGIMTSALWAVARTPALVEAIERVEAKNDEDASPLSLVLSQLGRINDLREAAEAADTFLRANRLTIHDYMEPMDAIRAIVGLCADSEQVLEEAVSTTYRTTMKCTMPGCTFKRDGGLMKEEQLECTKSPKVQLCIEIRANSDKKETLCDICERKGVAKRYVLEKPARCWVATWPALVQAKCGQEILFATDISSANGEQFRFKLGVMIANHRNKFVCMFREGNDYYRVEGKNVKLTSKKCWQDVQPCLALFNLQGTPGDKNPRSRSPRSRSPRSGSPRGTGFSCFLASNGGGQAGRKRQRQQIGYGQLSEGSSSRVQGSVAAAAAEVIEVEDDDDSDRGGADTPPPGGGGGGGGRGDADAGDRPNGDSSSGAGVGAPGENRTAIANGSEVKGKRGSRDGEREAEAKPPPRQAVGVDGSNSCEEVSIAGNPAAGSAGADSGGRPSARARVAGPEPPAAVPAVAATPARRKRTTARDGGRGAGSSPGATVTSYRREDQEAPRERDRKGGLVGPPRIPSFSGGSPRGSWMGQDGSPSEVGPSNGGGRGPSVASGGASSARRRSRYFDNPEGATRTPGHADLTAEANAGSRMDVAGEDDDDDDDDDVQLVASKRKNFRRGEEGGRRSSAAPSPSSSAAAAGSSSSSSSSRSAVSGGLPRQRDSERGARGAVSGGSLASSSSTRLREREVHDVDDDAPPTAPTLVAMPNGKKHPSSVSMAFIGPRSPPPPQSNGDAGFIGPARPPQPKSNDLLPRPRPPAQQQAASVGTPWLKRTTDEEARRKAAAAARANRGARKAGGGGATEGGGAGRQATITSSWEITGASSANGGGGGGGRSSSGSSSGKSAQRRPTGNGAVLLGAGGGSGSGYRLGGGSGSSGSSRQGGLRSGGEKVTEDLTGADESWQDLEDVKGAGVGRGWSTGFAGGGGEGNATLNTIRGINLQRDHFDRILDSDGWLTSQIIDIRVKQLQGLYPQHLYFDTSFFGFLCPSTERGGSFVVDYARVSGWTKAARLPAGKSSLFDMQKLFIPINQGNVHWVLVVVDMNGGGTSSAKKVSFFDSFGRDGTTYVEAVQQYLVSELSHRDKTRQERFAPRTLPPANAPRQHNSSDCGVLMLHAMEELSTGPASDLTRLTQDEIMSLRFQLVAKIVE